MRSLFSCKVFAPGIIHEYFRWSVWHMMLSSMLITTLSRRAARNSKAADYLSRLHLSEFIDGVTPFNLLYLKPISFFKIFIVWNLLIYMPVTLKTCLATIFEESAPGQESIKSRIMLLITSVSTLLSTPSLMLDLSS